MGTGWRRAFCTSALPRNSDVDAMADDRVTAATSPSPRSCTRLAFFSNPTTPRLHCRTSVPNSSAPAADSPALRCKTATHKVSKSPRPLLSSSSASASTSPRSPLKLSLFRNSFKSRNNCGVCAQSAKTGQGTAIYTAECGHGFHFPCIASHVRKELKLVCPVCSVNWKDVPLLAVVQTSSEVQQQDKTTIAETKVSNPKMEQKIKTNSSSPKQQYHHHSELKPVSVIRAYDDDESLLTPTAGSKFNPIPEADEDDEEERVEEFQGFFVNPIPSCSVDTSVGNNNGAIIHSSRNVDVKPMPEAAILSVNATHETYAVALRVKAPGAPSQPNQSQSQSRRAAVDLVAVLDVSPNMNGAKLYMLKRAMKLIISSLSSADRLSIVAFSGVTKRLLPLRRMTSLGQRSAKHIVDCLTPGLAGSCVNDALKKAVKVLEDRKERNHASTITVFSDGQDEHRCHQPSRYELVNIPVHDSGYGKIGSGSSDDGFAKFIEASLTVVAQDLRIKLNLAINGGERGEIAAVYCNNFKPTFLGSSSIGLGGLYAEEERELLVEIRIPGGTNSKPILTSSCSYRSPATMEAINCREKELMLPKLQPVRSTAQKIERLRNLFIVTRAIAEARGCDFVNARCLLVSARALVLQSSTTEMAAAEYVRGLEMELMEVARRQREEKVVAEMRRRKEEWGGLVDENGEPLTPTSAWKAAAMLAKVAMMNQSLNKVSDLHGFENARF